MLHMDDELLVFFFSSRRSSSSYNHQPIKKLLSDRVDRRKEYQIIRVRKKCVTVMTISCYATRLKDYLITTLEGY